jgi:hypothetical protein
MRVKSKLPASLLSSTSMPAFSYPACLYTFVLRKQFRDPCVVDLKIQLYVGRHVVVWTLMATRLGSSTDLPDKTSPLLEKLFEKQNKKKNMLKFM